MGSSPRPRSPCDVTIKAGDKEPGSLDSFPNPGSLYGVVDKAGDWDPGHLASLLNSDTGLQFGPNKTASCSQHFSFFCCEPRIVMLPYP